MKFNQILVLLIILNYLYPISSQRLFPTTRINEEGEVYEFMNWGVYVRKDAAQPKHYGYIGYISPFENIPQIEKIILSPDCLELFCLVSSLEDGMPNVKKVCNFKNKLDILL
jgi:hypothetical protein